MAANDDIADGLTRHQVRLIRFADTMRRKIARILNNAEPELRARLKGRLEPMLGGGVKYTKRQRQQLQALQKFLREENGPTFEAIKKLVRRDLHDLSRFETEFVAALIVGALPVSVILKEVSNRELRQVVLARPHLNQNLRTWLNRYEQNDQRRIMDKVREGIVLQQTPVEVSRTIFGTAAARGADGVREITRRGAQTLAQTLTNAVANAARQELYKRNRDIIPRELYVATLDSRTTPVCQSLDGKRFKVGQGPMPPVHVNCRSTRVPIIEGRAIGSRPAVSATEAQLGGLRGPARRRAVEKLVGRVPAETTYQDFLSRQSVAFQNEVLGPTRGRLFRKGELSVDSFVDVSTGKQYTLETLREREAEAFAKAGL